MAGLAVMLGMSGLVPPLVNATLAGAVVGGCLTLRLIGGPHDEHVLRAVDGWRALPEQALWVVLGALGFVGWSVAPRELWRAGTARVPLWKERFQQGMQAVFENASSLVEIARQKGFAEAWQAAYAKGSVLVSSGAAHTMHYVVENQREVMLALFAGIFVVWALWERWQSTNKSKRILELRRANKDIKDKAKKGPATLFDLTIKRQDGQQIPLKVYMDQTIGSIKSMVTAATNKVDPELLRTEALMNDSSSFFAACGNSFFLNRGEIELKA